MIEEKIDEYTHVIRLPNGTIYKFYSLIQNTYECTSSVFVPNDSVSIIQD